MLYHYTNENGLYGILNSKSLWLVSSMEMSDISDRFYGNLFATIALLKCDNEEVTLLRDNLTEKDILDVNMKALQTSFYSASFCKRNNNEYLWENYAGSNSGFCIEFNDNVLNEFINKIILENYEPLYHDEEITRFENDILNPRNVFYGYPEKLFIDANNITKKIALPDQKIINYDNHSHKYYKNWLFYILLLISGIIKSDLFNREEEIRLLFQDFYSDYNIKFNFFYLLEKIRLINALEKLGLSAENNIDEKKKKLELKFGQYFSSELIPNIYLGYDCKVNIESLKELLQNNGLKNTKLIKRERGKL